MPWYILSKGRYSICLLSIPSTEVISMSIRKNSCSTVALILLGCVLFTGCDSLWSTPINKILENPRDYSDKSVTISGEVSEVFSFFVIKYFVVKDKTGQMVVITKRPLPREGTKITVKGTVQEAFTLGDKQLIVIIEDEGK